MQLKARAPGSLMLLGEHAVLYGKPALVCAVNQYITVTLTPNLEADDKTIEIYSANYGHYETQLSSLTIQKPFQFVLAAISQLQMRIRRGFKLEITSEFSDQMGLGSSAAVTVATLAVIVAWLDMRIPEIELIRQGREVVRKVQGTGQVLILQRVCWAVWSPIKCSRYPLRK